MAILIKKASTGTPLEFFMVQSSDHITALTGATPTVTISKNGGAFASPSGAVSELANGWYQIAGNATDTNTDGSIKIHATAASGDPSDSMPYQVVEFDPYDAVHLGLSSLPNVASGSAGAIPTTGVGANQIQVNGSGGVSHVVLTDTLTTYTGNTPQTGDAFTRIGVAGVGLTNLGDTRIANLDAAVSSRMATYTQPTGFLAATFPSGTIANQTNITGGTITTVTNLTNAPTAGDLTATMKTSVATAALATQMTESYAANGVAPTLTQAACQLLAILENVVQSGTTITATKLDGTTTAMTFTLDSATAPTSRKRAT